MLSNVNTNSCATCDLHILRYYQYRTSSHSKDNERRLQAGTRFNLSNAKIPLFLEEKENKSTKRIFFQNLRNKYLFCSKKISVFAISLPLSYTSVPSPFQVRFRSVPQNRRKMGLT